MKWEEIIITTDRFGQEIIIGILSELGIEEYSIYDPMDIENLNENSLLWNYIDPSLIKEDKDKLSIHAFISFEEDRASIKKVLEERIENDPVISSENIFVEITYEEVEESDWANEWKSYYKPLELGDKIAIVPSWETYDNKDGRIIIDLDPGMAFGTGSHETTSMCIEALEKYLREGDLLYDIGTGSGILSIVGAKLGARSVGIDLDPMAVKVAQENSKRNKLEDKIEFLKGNLLDLLDEKADLIVANIIAEVIVDIVEDVKKKLREEGIFIASGIIVEKKDMVLSKLKEEGFTILEERTDKGWVCIVSSLR